MKTQQVVVIPAVPLGSAGDMRTKAEKMVELTERFLPHVDEVVRPKAKKGIAAMIRLILDGSPEISGLVTSVLKGSAPSARAKALCACGIGIGTVSFANLKRHVEHAVAEAVEISAMVLVWGWLRIFRTHSRGLRLIDTGDLDAAMLPPLDQEGNRLFAECCRRAHLSAAEARTILAKVRAGLSADVHFPEAAADYLEADIVTLFP